MRGRARFLSAFLALASVGFFLFLVTQARPSAAKPFPRFRFVAEAGSTILVHGTYPLVPSPCRAPIQPLLHARFSGTIEVGKDDRGRLFVINLVPFEDYLQGIAEVPRTWPMEALKAQVVAARSYALAHEEGPGSEGARLGYQICATTACQVYLGLGIADGPYGTRWRHAVEQTSGQVLLYRGRPADTLYFSTSNGHTIGNDEVFGSAPLPYLRPVVERDDGGSPVSHWRTVIAHTDVARFLRAAGDWTSKRVASVTKSGDRVVVRGGGTSRSMPVTEFRGDINAWAHCLDPAVYPTGSLPQTIPSKWFTTSNTHSSVILTGRGWGHGVGMVQWGAEGKASRGLSYRQILGYYYGGLRPQPVSEPSEIGVGVAVGLRSVVVEGSGTVVVQGKSVGPGPWLVTGGKLLRIRHGAAPPHFISPAQVISSPKRLHAGRRVSVKVFIPQLSVARLSLRQGSSQTVFGPPVTFRPGVATVRARVPSVPSGTYRLDVVVTDGIDVLNTRARTVRVTGIAAIPSTPGPTSSPPVSPSPTPSPSLAAAPPSEARRTAWIVLVAAIAAGALAIGLPVLVRRVRR